MWEAKFPVALDICLAHPQASHLHEQIHKYRMLIFSNMSCAKVSAGVVRIAAHLITLSWSLEHQGAQYSRDDGYLKHGCNWVTLLWVLMSMNTVINLASNCCRFYSQLPSLLGKEHVVLCLMCAASTWGWSKWQGCLKWRLYIAYVVISLYSQPLAMPVHNLCTVLTLMQETFLAGSDCVCVMWPLQPAWDN